jgi:hypothetical protein
MIFLVFFTQDLIGNCLTLQKYLVQKRFTHSISGHQETIDHFQDLHPMFNTLSSLKMINRPF